MIMDAHAHIFSRINGFNGENRTYGSGYGKVYDGNSDIQLMPPLNEQTIHTAEMLIAQMDWAGVDRAVLLQGPFYGDCNEYVRDAARKYPERLIALAYLDPWAEGAENYYKQWIDSGGYAGIKLECSDTTGFMTKYKQVVLDSPGLLWLWKGMEERGLTLTLDLGRIGSNSYQTDAVRKIAGRHPNLKIVIAHLGQPSPRMMQDQSLRNLWTRQIDLGLLDNVWFDSAALPHYYPEEPFPFPSAGLILKEVVERLGPDKVLWGTDIPGLLTAASYPQLVYMAELHLSFLNAADRDKILGTNAMKVYGRQALA